MPSYFLINLILPQASPDSEGEEPSKKTRKAPVRKAAKQTVEPEAISDSDRLTTL